jgi:RNA polymerase sigma factor for flagellar operon FliA
MNGTCPAIPFLACRNLPARQPIHALRPKPAAKSAEEIERRNHLLVELLPLVRKMAWKIHRHLPAQIACEDLYQTGVLGLMDALQKFDPRRNVRLRTYVKFRIQGAILDGLRETDWGSRALRRKAREVERAEQRLRCRLARTPEQSEIASELGVPLDEFQHLMGELRRLSVGRLEEVAHTFKDGAEQTYEEQLAAADHDGPFQSCADQELRRRLARAIECLPENERRVLSLYYYEEFNMQEIGEILSLGESRISQIHKQAMSHLRALLQVETAESQLFARPSAALPAEKAA